MVFVLLKMFGDWNWERQNNNNAKVEVCRYSGSQFSLVQPSEPWTHL